MTKFNQKEKIDMNKAKIWVTSDWHFCHDKSFCYSSRGYVSSEQMNRGLVNKHNALVSSNDIVYCLGDCFMGKDLDRGKKIIESLSGNLILLVGNHDTPKKRDMYASCKNVVELGEYSMMLKHKKWQFLLSHYPTLTANFDDEKFAKSRVINLAGHSHINLPFFDWERYNSPIYHCEVDAHNGYPILLDDIINQIEEKVNENKVERV